MNNIKKKRLNELVGRKVLKLCKVPVLTLKTDIAKDKNGHTKLKQLSFPPDFKYYYGPAIRDAISNVVNKLRNADYADQKFTEVFKKEAEHKEKILARRKKRRINKKLQKKAEYKAEAKEALRKDFIEHPDKYQSWFDDINQPDNGQQDNPNNTDNNDNDGQL